MSTTHIAVLDDEADITRLVARYFGAQGFRVSELHKGAALVPSAKKHGGMGTAVDVPLGHKDAAFVRSHFDAMEARIVDAPRANEIVVAVVVTDSGRPLPRIGGLQVHEIKGQDGLR